MYVRISQFKFHSLIFIIFQLCLFIVCNVWNLLLASKSLLYYLRSIISHQSLTNPTEMYKRRIFQTIMVTNKCKWKNSDTFLNYA